MHSFRHNPASYSPVRMCFFCLLIALSGLLTACAGNQPQLSNAQRSPTTLPVFPTLTPTPTAPRLLRPDFERGMIYPRWQPNSYGESDTTWQQGIQTIKTQTGSTWLEIPVLFSQATSFSTEVGPGTSTPNLDAFASGIRRALSLGYHVFFVPLSAVNVQGDWAGTIRFDTQQQEKAWFDNYWNALRPYATVAQENGAEQMAIGTELVWLEHNAPASLWNELIARVRSVFKGTLTYDVNWWPSLHEPPVSWLKNPELNKIGLSDYLPLTDTPDRLDPNAMPGLWKNTAGKLIDDFSKQVGKQVIITEIGYCNVSDPFYSFNGDSTAPVDAQEQAAAYAAALINAFADQHIGGIFFWGWDGLGRWNIAGQQAAQVVYRWYTRSV